VIFTIIFIDIDIGGYLPKDCWRYFLFFRSGELIFGLGIAIFNDTATILVALFESVFLLLFLR